MIQTHKDGCQECFYWDNAKPDYRQRCDITHEDVEAKGKRSTGFVYPIPGTCPFKYDTPNTYTQHPTLSAITTEHHVNIR